MKNPIFEVKKAGLGKPALPGCAASGGLPNAAWRPTGNGWVTVAVGASGLIEAACAGKDALKELWAQCNCAVTTRMRGRYADPEWAHAHRFEGPALALHAARQATQ